MKIEKIISNAETITTLNRFNEIIQQPRAGKIYVYHEGVIAEDKVLDKKMSEEKIKEKKELSNISHFVNRYAEKNELMPFQKRITDHNYIYFFVR